MEWSAIAPGLAVLGVTLEPEALPRLRRLRELVVAENARTNLTRIVDEPEFVEKHVFDSLAGLAAAPEGVSRVADVGSGGGFPGLPLAIARPGWSVVLIESLQKKAAFLERAARALGLANVSVLAERAEDVARRRENREAFDLVTVRAVASAAATLELALPLVKPGGRVLLYRGPEEAASDDEKVRAVAPLVGGGEPRAVEYALRSGAARRLIVVPKVTATPERFPRKTGLAEKRPLA